MNSKTTYQTGQAFTNTRPPALLIDGKYFTMQQPTYKEYNSESFINIKAVPGLPVAGDGTTDDTVNINRILRDNAGCKIIYFPAGTYIVSNTLLIPPGTRITGDAFASTISAIGSVFTDAKSPVAMIKVGNPGDVGVAQMNDLMLTTADILPGCKLVSSVTITQLFTCMDWVHSLTSYSSKSIWQATSLETWGCGMCTFELAVALDPKYKQDVGGRKTNAWQHGHCFI